MKNLTVVFVSFKTPTLSFLTFKSFEKFNKIFNLKYIIVENSNFDQEEYFKKLIKKEERGTLERVDFVSNPTDLKNSFAHADGLEKVKNKIDTDYVFTCHSDVCVTSEIFFEELSHLIDEKYTAAAVSYDAHPDRIQGMSCTGLLVDTKLFQNTCLRPKLPKLDVIHELTIKCRENKLKTKVFKNTYNDRELSHLCNEPYRSLGPNCGIDRCLDENNQVIFMHQGRGTTKHQGNYANAQKISTAEWINLCSHILG